MKRSTGLRGAFASKRGPALLAVLLLGSCACAVNPATGKRQLMVISESQEVEIGREADVAVRKQYGVYTEKAGLAAYVNSVGQALAAKSDRPTLTYTFQVVDSPEINAFALPGGFIYATRGILALMNSEDELAAVLGHELAHVTARHGASQLSKAQAAQIGLLGVAVLSDPQYADLASNTAAVALTLAMQGYSREDEREADDLGVKYAKRAGYNPIGAIELMKAFGRLESSEPSRVEKWFASHPETSERIRNIREDLQAMRRNHSESLDRPIRRDGYLKQIDGLLVGNANQSGFVSGSRYVSRAFDYSVAIPEGWVASLEGGVVRMGKPSSGVRADIRVESLAKASTAAELAKEYARRAETEGLEVLGPVTKAGLPAGQGAVVELRTRDRQGAAIHVRRLFLSRFDRSYTLTFACPAEAADETRDTFQTLTGSIKFTGAGEGDGASPRRLRLHTAASGETWGSIAETELGRAARAKELAELNGRAPDSAPEPGMLVKIVP